MKVIKKVRKWLRDKLDDEGREKLDSTPVEIPIGFERPPTLEEQVRRLMYSEYDRLRQSDAMSGMESPEEADDFDIEDDPIDQNTPYEEYFFLREQDLPPITENEDFKLTSEEIAKQANSDATSPKDALGQALPDSTEST